MYDNKVHYELKYTPREIQIESLEFTKTNINRGKKYIMLNMPTGTGKSYYSVMFMNWYLNYINGDAKFDILTNSKILQSQYVREFDFMASLKGKNSYTCKTYNTSCQEGKEMNKALKRTCSNCPYDYAFGTWKESQVSLTNFHLMNTLHLFIPEVIEERASNVLIIDEAHDFESILCDYISVKISSRSLMSYGFNDINMMSTARKMANVYSVDDFKTFLNDIFLTQLEELQEKHKSRLGNHSITSGEKLKLAKYVTNITTAISTYTSFLKDIEENGDNWVIDIDREDSKIFPKSFNVQPVWSYKYLKKIIWDKYDHIIYMSGTMLDKTMFSFLNGIEENLGAYYNVESPFPIKNRPIYYVKVGKMTFNEKAETWKRQTVVLDKILKRNIDKKGIIHTGSYELANWVKEHYKGNKRLLFHTSEDRDAVLFKHMESPEPTILVSPSMTNGVDLKDDLSRFQVILKIPYPSIKSNKIKKRQADYKDWYAWKTVVDIIQSYGRSVRSEDDWAETYIIDESFSNILRYSYKFLPKYFTDAIKTLK